MFAFLRRWLQREDRIVYLRFRKEKVYLGYYPPGETSEALPIIAVIKKKDAFRVAAVGQAVLQLPPQNCSVVYTPFAPFDLEPENFELAELTLRYLLKENKAYKSAWVGARFVMHPDKSYLSEQEEDAYRELGMRIGAREVRVYVGSPLDEPSLKALFDQ